MRILLLLLADLFWAVRALVELPFRAFRKKPRYVRIALKGSLPYRAPRRRFKGRGRSLEALLARLDGLERDPALEGILLEVDALTLSPAKREVLAERLRRFRAAGKKVVGYGVSLGNAEYELLCAADRIVLSPAGRLELVGYAAELMALGRGLEQVGVHADFVRRGEYKTAPELFTEAEISPIQRRTIEGFLDARYLALLEAISRGRNVTLEAARSAVDLGPYGARRALEAGWVDEVATAHALRQSLGAEGGRKKPAPPIPSPKAWDRSRTVRPRPDRRYRARPRVSVIPLSGNIVHGEGASLPWGPRALGSDAVLRALEQAASAPSEAAVLFVDSPGGSAIASELMLEGIERLAERKPVVAYVDRVAASGGYMAAIGAKELWSAPHALVGSIGVFAGKFDASGLLERLGIRVEVVARGAHAGMQTFARGFSPSERDALEREVEETYQSFLALVAKARGQSSEWVHARGEGRVFTGTDALDKGLVDRLGTFEAACLRAAELADVRTRAVELFVHTPMPKPRSRLERLLPSGKPGIYALWWPWLSLPDLGDPDSTFSPAQAPLARPLIEWVRAATS